MSRASGRALVQCAAANGPTHCACCVLRSRAQCFALLRAHALALLLSRVSCFAFCVVLASFALSWCRVVLFRPEREPSFVLQCLEHASARPGTTGIQMSFRYAMSGADLAMLLPGGVIGAAHNTGLVANPPKSKTITHHRKPATWFRVFVSQCGSLRAVPRTDIGRYTNPGLGSGRHITGSATSRRARYAMSGTDVEYAATSGIGKGLGSGSGRGSKLSNLRAYRRVWCEQSPRRLRGVEGQHLPSGNTEVGASTARTPMPEPASFPLLGMMDEGNDGGRWFRVFDSGFLRVACDGRALTCVELGAETAGRAVDQRRHHLWRPG
eukprot:2459033-Rhodomonas_salina.1